MWKVREVQHKKLLAENRTRKQNSVCAPDYGIVSVNLTVSAFFFPNFLQGTSVTKFYENSQSQVSLYYSSSK